MQNFYGGRPKTWKWLPMTFGKYERFTLPEIAFLDPGYIPWLIENEVIEQKGKYSRELARQAKYIAMLIRRIVPAKAPRDEYEFLILVDSQGAFGRAITVRKGHSMPKKYKGKYHLDKRCDVLDALVFNLYKKPKLGSTKMASSLRKTLFPYLGRPPVAADYEQFMITNSNFGLIKRASRSAISGRNTIQAHLP
jgi:hypothetical protein